MPVTVNGIRELQTKLIAVRKRVDQRYLTQALRPAAQLLLDEERSRVPRGATGNLYRSLRIANAKQRVGLVIGPGHSRTHPGYAAHLVESGTKAHFIFAGRIVRKGRVIRSTGKQVLSNGSMTFGRWMHHPGSRANPFIKASIDAVSGRMLQMIKDQVAMDIIVDWGRA